MNFHCPLNKCIKMSFILQNNQNLIVLLIFQMDVSDTLPKRIMFIIQQRQKYRSCSKSFQLWSIFNPSILCFCTNCLLSFLPEKLHKGIFNHILFPFRLNMLYILNLKYLSRSKKFQRKIICFQKEQNKHFYKGMRHLKESFTL